ncbi:helicase associated domain-containing protein, partial [Streptomyces sp. NPDC058701]|uniref:helicase associated domain-containing protein n=1 Tax=Streptomyces sp. NPDC058701 TaxID=3346608 RepID=UPI003659693F
STSPSTAASPTTESDLSNKKLGMIWSHFNVAWEEGLAAARGWAAEHGHLLAPLDAAHQATKSASG